MKAATRARLRFAGLVIAGYTLYAVFFTGYRVLAPLAEGKRFTWGLLLQTAVEEASGAYGAALLFPVFLWFVRRHTLSPRTTLRYLPLYALLLVVSSVALTSFMWGTRKLIFPLVGLGTYHYGIMPLRFPMEFFLQAVHFMAVIGFIHFFIYYQKTRDQEVRAAQLESQLTRARLENLQAQLHPHFLFNTLNTISSLMYHDAGAADRLMTRLSDLLRMTFSRSSASETTVDAELGWIDAYLAIMQERFGSRLTVRRDVAADTGHLLVPTLILQPLVENAIRHGIAPHRSGGTVEIVTRRDATTLHIEVRDDGAGLPPGFAVGIEGNGMGLRNTAARLRHAYGAAHRFALERRPSGGTVVVVEIPAHDDGPAPDAPGRAPA